jgi:dihydroflavonol-4-reductase
MVLITGASGILGQALTRQLVLEGKPVRILLRDMDSPGFEGLNVQRVEGNVRDLESLEQAFDGVETVYHTAALPSNLPGMYDDLYQVNVQGTRNVIAACRVKGVAKLVYVTNFQALGRPKSPDKVCRESDGFIPERAYNSYGKTMAFACQAVSAAHDQNLSTMILLPSFQIGPHDYKLSLLGRFWWDYARGRVAVLVNGGFEMIDTRDAAAAIVRASQKGRWGESYLLSSGYIKVPDFINWLEALSGRDSPRLYLPNWLLWPAAAFMEWRYKLRSEQPVLNRASLSLLRQKIRIDCSKAKADFGFQTRSRECTFAETWKWMAEHYHLVKVQRSNLK